MASTGVQDSPVYQLKIALKGVKPEIWRRIQVRGNTTMARLHRIIQVVMGWADYHLHEFTVDGVRYGIPDPDFGTDVKDDRRFKLSQLVSHPTERFLYEYDFGDCWEHQIVVEEVTAPLLGVRYPVCLGGKRACSPEDVGGIWGYAEFLQAIRHPRHPGHERMLEWVGGEFDPEAFDLDQVNRRLKRR